jgi:DNA-binding response OmpR family regulator
VSWLGSEGGSGAGRVLRVGGISLDLNARRLEVDGKLFALTPKQLALLGLFMSHPGEVLTRKQIMKQVWETDYTGDTRTLDVHIHWVRQKLGEMHGQPRYLQTVRGVGYQFVYPDSAQAPEPAGNG